MRGAQEIYPGVVADGRVLEKLDELLRAGLRFQKLPSGEIVGRWAKRIAIDAGPYWAPYNGQGPDVRCCRVTGITSVYDGDVWVDASIAPLIARLNELGHVTEFCCSHLDEDHREKPGAVWGYVQFRDNPPAAVPGAFVQSANGFHVRLKDGLTNDEKLAAWREWEAMLG